MAARLLARRAYTTAELVARLEQKGYRVETAATTARRCVELGWIDDARLAHDRAEALRGRGAGSLKIQADLETRGLTPSLIELAVAASLGEQSELEWARTALARAKIDPEDAPARAWRLLAGRGFPDEILVTLVGEPD